MLSDDLQIQGLLPHAGHKFLDKRFLIFCRNLIDIDIGSQPNDRQSGHISSDLMRGLRAFLTMLNLPLAIVILNLKFSTTSVALLPKDVVWTIFRPTNSDFFGHNYSYPPFPSLL